MRQHQIHRMKTKTRTTMSRQSKLRLFRKHHSFIILTPQTPHRRIIIILLNWFIKYCTFKSQLTIRGLPRTYHKTILLIGWKVAHHVYHRDWQREVDHKEEPQRVRTRYTQYKITSFANRVIYYLVEWSPPGRFEDSWEPVCNLSCNRLVLEYWERRALIEYQTEMRSQGIDPAIYTRWCNILFYYYYCTDLDHREPAAKLAQRTACYFIFGAFGQETNFILKEGDIMPQRMTIYAPLPSSLPCHSPPVHLVPYSENKSQ